MKSYKKTHYPSLRTREIPTFLDALEALKASDQDRIAFKMLLLTALRSGELRRGRWEDIDFGAGEWRVPAEMMKMRDEHIVPLSSQVISMLEDLKTLTGNQEWLFPNQKGWVHPVMNENRINVMIETMATKEKWWAMVSVPCFQPF